VLSRSVFAPPHPKLIALLFCTISAAYRLHFDEYLIPILYFDLIHFYVSPHVYSAIAALKPHSARTGPVFFQLSAAVVRHKANDGVVYAIRAWFKYDTALSAVV